MCLRACAFCSSISHACQCRDCHGDQTFETDHTGRSRECGQILWPVSSELDRRRSRNEEEGKRMSFGSLDDTATMKRDRQGMATTWTSQRTKACKGMTERMNATKPQKKRVKGKKKRAPDIADTFFHQVDHPGTPLPWSLVPHGTLS